jgi:RNA polymerase sigma factor (sigma-70 family)
LDSDEALALQAQQGSHEAFNTLYARHRADLARHCARLLANTQEGEQAAQDTIVIAWTKVTNFRGDGSFQSWLRSIATDVCLKLLRTRKGKDLLQRQSLDHPATMHAVEAHQSASGLNDVVAEKVIARLDAQQLIRRIQETARTSKPRWDALDWDIFELHYVQGIVSRREVATRLEQDENKVKYRIYHRLEPVFRKVREAYEADCAKGQ